MQKQREIQTYKFKKNICTTRQSVRKIEREKQRNREGDRDTER